MSEINLTKKEKEYLIKNTSHNSSFRHKLTFEAKVFHRVLLYSIFRPQLYRIYSLLAKELGINTVVYDYLEGDNNYILFCESMIKGNEVLYEHELHPDNPLDSSCFQNWIDIVETLAISSNSNIKEDFCKQIFYSLLIFDQDKEIALIGQNNNYKLSPYYDYGGVYWNQNQLELEDDLYYVKDGVYFQEMFELTDRFKIEEIITREFNQLIEKEILKYSTTAIDDYDFKLRTCLDYLDCDFINYCLNIDISKIIEQDTSHVYSDNMKKLLEVMFKHSQRLLRERIVYLKQRDNSKKVSGK